MILRTEGLEDETITVSYYYSQCVIVVAMLQPVQAVF